MHAWILRPVPISLHPQRATVCRSPLMGFDQAGQQHGSHDLYYCRARAGDPRRGCSPHKGHPVLSKRSLFSNVQIFGTRALTAFIWNLAIELRPTSSSLTSPLAVAMSGSHPKAKAACRDRVGSPRVGFRAGITNLVQRCVERIFFSQAPGTNVHHAGSTLSHSKRSPRTLSLTDEESYVARQVREIYCKLQTTLFQYISTSNH